MKRATMKAVTLYPEHAHCVAWLGKPTENRTWEPPESVIGERIAIHAGARIGGGTRVGARISASMIRGILGFDLRDEMIARRAVVAVATIASVDREQRTRWDLPDHYHWRLTDVVTLIEPVTVQRGRLGLWRLTEEQERLVLSTVAEQERA